MTCTLYMYMVCGYYEFSGGCIGVHVIYMYMYFVHAHVKAYIVYGLWVFGRLVGIMSLVGIVLEYMLYTCTCTLYMYMLKHT